MMMNHAIIRLLGTKTLTVMVLEMLNLLQNWAKINQKAVSNDTDICPNDPENDSDGDGVCESDEIPEGTDEIACNFDDEATEEDESCIYLIAIIVHVMMEL